MNVFSDFPKCLAIIYLRWVNERCSQVNLFCNTLDGFKPRCGIGNQCRPSWRRRGQCAGGAKEAVQ